jgi:LmbE family N-acetylglucosaminyl deacetylase
MVIPNRILVLSPHADDGELGCGGTITRWLEEGKDIYYVVFSSCRKSIPYNLPPDTLVKECHCSCKILGVSPDKIILMDYEVRSFPAYRQEILESLIKLKQDIRPQIVLTPSSSDTHQDHNTIYWETVRAFKKEASIWGYMHPWNSLISNFDIFVRLEERHLDRKIEALKCYQSQANRSYFNEKYLRAHSYSHGTQVDYQYAETFELIRMLV